MASLQDQLAGFSKPAQTPDSDSTPTARVFKLLQRFLPDDATKDLPLDTALGDLAVDSLDRIEFAVRLEQEFGARIDEEIFEQFHTVGDICEFAAAQAQKG